MTQLTDFKVFYSNQVLKISKIIFFSLSEQKQFILSHNFLIKRFRPNQTQKTFLEKQTRHVVWHELANFKQSNPSIAQPPRPLQSWHVGLLQPAKLRGSRPNLREPS